MAQQGETMLGFLDRVAGPAWDRIRDLLEEWVAGYPQESRAELVGRLRSKDGVDFRSAFWELYLFRLLTVLGADVRTHPNVPGTASRPDFAVEGMDGQFYLEAKVVEPDDTSRTRAQQRDQIWNALNANLSSEHYFLKVELDRAGPRPAPTSHLCRRVGGWLDSLDARAVGALHVTGGRSALPSLEWDHPSSGWKVTVTAIPKRSHQSTDQIVGLGGPEAMFTSDRIAIRSALKKKYSKYGSTPDRPLVVALGINRMGVDRTDMVDALFGDEVVTFNKWDPADATLSRAPNGLLVGGNAPRAARLSAALVRTVAQPWNLTTHEPDLWINPWAEHEFVARFPNAATHQVTGHDLATSPATKTSAEVFSLAADWPGANPFGRRR